MVRNVFVLSVLLFCAAAFGAADNFTFNYVGNNGDYASGTLITTAQGGGQFLITNIGPNAMVDGFYITAILPPGSFAGNDNLLFVPPNPGSLDIGGFSFSDNMNENWNIFYAAGTYQLDLSGSGVIDTSGTFTITPVGSVPEPGSFLLLGTGLLATAGKLGRRYVG